MTPGDSPLTLEDVMTSPLYQDLATPMVSEGDMAFDFVLPRLHNADETVRLSDFRGHQPVALIFGSYT